MIYVFVIVYDKFHSMRNVSNENTTKQRNLIETLIMIWYQSEYIKRKRKKGNIAGQEK